MTWKSEFQLENGADYAPRKSWIFLNVEVREKTPGFSGLFSLDEVPVGTVIAQDGGVVIAGNDFVHTMPQKYRGMQIQIFDYHWLSPNNPDAPGNLHYMNHSCDSNVARIGMISYISKKPIKKGDELTCDYAPMVSGLTHWKLECKCGSGQCRGTITGLDHLKSDLAKKLWPEWLPKIQKEILNKSILDPEKLT